jgi:transcriptional regulator with XRE-family HTH domain
MLASLKEARLAHHPPLRLIDVAERAGVSVSLVCMVEKGLQSPSREAIAQAVGASYGSFWENGAAA